MRRTKLFLLMILLLIGTLGCSMKGQLKIDRMVSYINNKYIEDSFQYVKMTGGHLGSNVTKIVVKSERFPGKEIRVICSEVDGKEIFTDTYLNVKFEDQTREYLKSRLSEVYGDNIYLKYVPDDTACTENGSDNTTFAEYISDPSTYVYFFAVVAGNVTDESATFALIRDIFSDAVVSGHIFFINTDEFLSDKALNYIEKKNYDKKLYFIKETVTEYSKVKWES